MRLVSFTVENYRSIIRAHKIRTDQSTVLIGPNNEGKSNILRALVAAMHVLTRGSILGVGRPEIRLAGPGVRTIYDWSRDFPVHLQKKTPGESIVILEFELTAEEIEAFRQDIKSNLNGTLPLRITFAPDKVKVEVAKQGKGAKTLSSKSGKIARFVASRLDFEHIPAVRTANEAIRIVNQLVERELAPLERNPDYIDALNRIQSLQEPLLRTLSDSIKDTLIKFLPDISDVELQISSERRYRALRQCEIVVNDGEPTLLQYKGDGVQSLAALGIMRHASERLGTATNLVIAIEEPESHLHPNAIHGLRDVLSELSQKHQLVISTHCPLFVYRPRINCNIIVKDKKARPATSIQEIREILGVRASDNLRHAELVLLVEGSDDEIALSSLLCSESTTLQSAFKNGIIAIETLTGATNLPYKVGLIVDALCRVHCFLDYDKTGIGSFNKARLQGLLTEADVNFSTCQGMAESELEDLYDPSVYTQAIENTYGVTLKSAKFRTNEKWSHRLHETFRQQGKHWDDRLEIELKLTVAKLVESNPQNALHPSRRSSFDSLMHTLEQKIVATSCSLHSTKS